MGGRDHSVECEKCGCAYGGLNDPDTTECPACAEWDAKYRWCIYCKADCYADEPEHAADCPSATGVFPVRDEKHCPSCTCTLGMRCCECGAVLKAGDHYMHRELEPGNELVPGLAGAAVYECVCIGCASVDAMGEERK